MTRAASAPKRAPRNTSSSPSNCHIRSRFRSALWTGIAVIMGIVAGAETQAHAQDKVVLESFQGRGSAKIRAAARGALRSSPDIAVVPDKVVKNTVRQMGLTRPSDAYQAVASELGATAFVTANVSGGKDATATFVVRGPKGRALGRPTYNRRGLRKLAAAVRSELAGDVERLLSRVARRPAVAQSRPEARQEAPASRQSSLSDPYADETDDEVDRTPDSTAGVSGSPSGDDGYAMGFQLTGGAFLYQRDFEYNELVRGGNQVCSGGNRGQNCPAEYSGPATAVLVSADYYFMRHLGLTAGGEFTILTTADQDDGDGGSQSFDVASMAFWAGLRGRYNLDALQLGLSGLFGQRGFEVTDSDVLPPVTYMEAKVLADARYQAGSFAAFVNAGYIQVLSMGDFTLDEYFPNATASGAEVTVGASYGVLDSLDAVASVTVRQYGIAMNSEAEDTNVAGGATDGYMGVFVGVAYRPGF